MRTKRQTMDIGHTDKIGTIKLDRPDGARGTILATLTPCDRYEDDGVAWVITVETPDGVEYPEIAPQPTWNDVIEAVCISWGLTTDWDLQEIEECGQ